MVSEHKDVSIVALPGLVGWLGMLQNGIRVLFGVAWLNLGGRGCYNMVLEPWF
jgi:hypothetical protein